MSRLEPLASTLSESPLKPIYLCGTTASGKSQLAISLAQALNGEVINVDPYQSYQGLPILTATPSLKERKQVPHHLYQVFPLNESLDAARFSERVHPVAQEVIQRGHVPILVGGSGMYLKFLTHGSSALPSADPSLRAQMEQMTVSEIRFALEELDPEESKRLCIDNRRHLSRALEICWLTGQKASTYRSEWEHNKKVLEKNLLGLTLVWPRSELVQRIEQRTQHMFTEEVIDEVRRSQNLSPSSTAIRAIGYELICQHLRGERSQEDCMQQIVIATRQYAKRQANWFRRERWLHEVPAPWHLDQVLALLSSSSSHH